MKNIKRNFAEALEIPEEIVLNLPLITMTGRERLVVENYKGVIEYDEKQIRLNTSIGILKIEGDSLVLKNIAYESITILGVIKNMEFLI